MRRHNHSRPGELRSLFDERDDPSMPDGDATPEPGGEPDETEDDGQEGGVWYEGDVQIASDWPEEWEEFTDSERREMATMVAYANAEEWAQGERRRLGLAAGVDISLPAGFRELLLNGDVPTLAARAAMSFDFDQYEVVVEDGEARTVRRPDEFEVEPQEPGEFTIVLPNPHSGPTCGEIDEREAAFREECDRPLAEHLLHFVDGETGYSRFIDVPGLRCELQYVVAADGRQTFLFRSGTEQLRRAALASFLLEIMSDPVSVRCVQGVPEWWERDSDTFPESYTHRWRPHPDPV